MTVQELLTGLGNITGAALTFFFILGLVLIAELWYLRPKRKLPPIPPSVGAETSLSLPGAEASLPPKPEGFSPLSQKQIYLVGLLVFLLVIIPFGVFLFKRTQEAKKEVALIPSPTAVVGKLAPPTKTPFPLPTSTLVPLSGQATPSATPRELAVSGLTTPTPTPTLRPRMSPTPAPGWLPKGGFVSATPSATPLPKAQKPKELPDASFSAEVVFLVIAGLLALLVGTGEAWERLKR